MKRFLLSLLVLFLALGAHAQELVTATVTVVDIPNNGDTIVVNGNTRTWTNTPINGVSWIPTTNTLVATTTNLHLHIAATPFTALQLAYTASDAIRLQGSAVSVSFAGTWATVAYSTQAVTSLIAVRVPVAGIPLATNRTFVGVHLLQAINDYATNSFDNNAIALTNFLNLGPASQEVTGPKLFHSISGTNTSLVGGVIDGASITNSTLYGTVGSLAGGLWIGGILSDITVTNGILITPTISGAIFEAAYLTNAFLLNPTFTNGINYGLAFSSPGTPAGSQQFGIDAVATETNQFKIGTSGHTLSVPGDVHFGQKLAVGSDNYSGWVSGMNRGIAFLNGSSPDAAATNSWVAYSEAGQAFYRTGATSEGAEANNRMHNRAAEAHGSGTAYSFTESTARIDLGGLDSEITLPTAGTYLVTGLVQILNGATDYDEYRVKFVNSTDATDIAFSERVISSIPANAFGQLTLLSVVTVNDSKEIELWGFNATALRGSVISAGTSLTYVRLY